MAKGRAVYATLYQILRMDVWFAKTMEMVEKNARRYVMTAISSIKRLQNNSFTDFSSTPINNPRLFKHQCPVYVISKGYLIFVEFLNVTLYLFIFKQLSLPLWSSQFCTLKKKILRNIRKFDTYQIALHNGM